VPITRLDHADPELLEELLAVTRAVASTGAFTMGAEVEGFEAEFAAYCGTRHAIGVSSGTEALSLAVRALGIGPGDEVIVPANSFVATAEAVAWAGAVPRLVDVDPATHLLTADLVAEAIGPMTRAVIPVHLMGSMVDLGPITELADAAGIDVIEDAAQAHGALQGARRAGGIGRLGCFSFYPTKNLGAWGDGGAVVTDDDELAATLRLLRSHGESPRYHHRILGTTARLDALQAAVLRVKLARLDGWNDARRRLAATLDAALAGTHVRRPDRSHAGADHVHHLYVVRSHHRDALRAHLEARGVATAVHYPIPIHRTPAFDTGALLPGAELLAGEICTLPLYPAMTAEEVEQVVDAVACFDPEESA
jgi:dTDP-4-amino-4,6-dideoxygalactose transaminase